MFHKKFLMLLNQLLPSMEALSLQKKLCMETMESGLVVF